MPAQAKRRVHERTATVIDERAACDATSFEPQSGTRWIASSDVRAHDEPHDTVPRMSAITPPAEPRLPTPLLPPRLMPAGERRATLTLVAGPDAGHVFVLGGEPVLLGRAAAADIQIDDAGVSRRHARLTRLADGAFQIQDLDSTNGTWIRGKRVRSARLMPGDYVQLGGDAIVRFSFADDLEVSLQDALHTAAIRDPLTQLFNRQYFTRRLSSDIAYALHAGSPVGLLMIDVDRFKLVNDCLGHAVGDRVLRELARTLGTSLRVDDLLARYGGEEFVVVAPFASAEEVRRLAERLREAVCAHPIAHERGLLALSVSIGVAMLSEVDAERAPAALLELADRRLYEAKSGGRNAVCAGETTPMQG
jgi:diguanylate cyclase (GGDEF)-like protein